VLGEHRKLPVCVQPGDNPLLDLLRLGELPVLPAHPLGRTAALATPLSSGLQRPSSYYKVSPGPRVTFERARITGAEILRFNRTQIQFRPFGKPSLP